MKYGDIPSGHVIVPWITDEPFLKALGEISGRTLLHHVKCYMLYSIVRHLMKVPGEVAECGAYRGGSSYLIAKVLDGRKRLYMFDTFAGIPAGVPGKDNRYINGGEFADTSLEDVQRFMAPFKNVEIRKGFVPDTFAGLEANYFSFVHIDLDIYRPILESLEFFYPRMSSGGVILLDDYGSEECQGAYMAVEEFCAARGTRPIVLPTGQAMLICRI
jgi:O-methyltransferase